MLPFDDVIMSNGFDSLQLQKRKISFDSKDPHVTVKQIQIENKDKKVVGRYFAEQRFVFLFSLSCMELRRGQHP